MVSKDHDLSVRRQCELLLLARSNLYYQLKGETAENLCLMAVIHCLAGHVYIAREGISSFGYTVVWLTPNGAVYATSGLQMRTAQGATFNASDVFGADLSDTEHQQEAPTA